MQNKGAIRLFAILLALVCIYQLSFTFITQRAEKQAIEKANGDSLLEKAYMDSLNDKKIFNILVTNYTYKECKEREINLGLDLKGGMNVVLEISVIDVIRSLSNYSNDPAFNQALTKAREMQKNSKEDFVGLFGKAFTAVAPGDKLSRIFNTRELSDRINPRSTDAEVLNIIRKESEGAIDNSFEILRKRIDKFGVTQPNIQKLETSGRILVELPGVKDPVRVRKLLQGTASLEFWETYDNREIFPILQNVNDKLRDIKKLEKDTLQSDTTQLAITAAPADSIKETADNTKADTASLSLLDDMKKDTASSELTDASTNENLPLFSIMSPNMDRQGNLAEGTSVIGFASFKDTAAINDIFEMKQMKSLLKRDLKLLWSIKAAEWDEKKNIFELHAIKVTGKYGKAPLTGDKVTSARKDFSQTGGSAQVNMTMNAEGTKIWARMTRENVNKAIAIVIDNYVYSAPRVINEITGGSSVITGNFTVEEADDLSNVLKSGKMPAPARIIEEEVVGPTLGKEAINAGMISFIIAFFVVLIYMIIYYHRAGWVADLALIANVLFIFGVLASFQAVLTLPGLAGIVLTLGMAVDANVIIFERVREELRAGKGLRMALADGYNNAYSAIIDGNVTTILTGIILFIFGTGPVQGFATTLIIGILTSLFSGIFITRLIFEGLLNRNQNIKFGNKLTNNFLVNTKIPFIEIRKILYVVSGIVIAIGLFSIFTKGLSLGIDFKGGRTYIVRFDEKVLTTDIQKGLRASLGETPEVKTYGSDKQVKITTKFMIDENSENMNVDSIVESKIFEGLQSFMNTNATKESFHENYLMSSQKVSPVVSYEIMQKAIWAIVFSLIGIFLYIFIRFKDWRYSLGGITSLAHDVLIVIGIYSIFQNVMPFSMEIDQAFIAAILTVIGYSINDTVIIYDRIREWTALYPKREKKELFNGAMNSTLGRTLNTSLTTLFTLIVMFIWGGEVIRGFIFALLVGIGIGTYSSIFNAAPIVYDTLKKKIKSN